MSSVRFSLIGCGRIAKNHVGPLRELRDAELVAVCDLCEDRAKVLSERCGVPMYTNYHSMLSEEQVDVVSILTPSGMHCTHATDIMRRYRKHVVIEKPMALAWNDLDRMKAVAAEHGVRIFPVYQNRYNKAVQKIRDDLTRGPSHS